MRRAAQYLYYIDLDNTYMLFYFDSEYKGDGIQSGFDKIVSSFQLNDNGNSQDRESGDTVLEMDAWIGMDIREYFAKIRASSNWKNNITLKKLSDSTDGVATYGFLLIPKDMPIEEQYVGALCIYDEAYWNQLDEFTESEEIKLSVIDEKVFTYRNSLFNQYTDLPQAELFDALVLADEDVTKRVFIKRSQ